MKLTRSLKVGVAAAGFVAALASAGFAGAWAGKYMTEDTKGNPFAITLSADGTAAGEKLGHALNGTWADDGDAAVITWTTGWTTKISKDGDRYKKSAYRPGAAIADGPVATTDVEKVE
jgi:hypothetical protein